MCAAGDWPMWRYDAGRSGVSPHAVAEDLHLQWVRHYPPLQPAFWQVRQERVQFDLGYEPVVSGQTLLVGSSRNDRITALDTRTGEERWRFYAEGPIRLAPVIQQGRVYVGSDDGFLYCLDATSGALLWRHRAAPSDRRVVGNGRLISVWPVRGGPVVADERVFLASGVWPFEGVFVWGLEAATGQPVWVNDRCGALYLEHPHAAMAFGGPSPHGYLLVRGNAVIVPSARAFPAYFDRDTGKLLDFDFGYAGHGSRPGSWFVIADPAGEMQVDPQLNREMHDVGLQVLGQRGARPEEGEVRAETVMIGRETYRLVEGLASRVSIGGREYNFHEGFPGVEGQVHSVLAGDGRLFVVTREGAIHAFGPEPTEPRVHQYQPEAWEPTRDVWQQRVAQLLERTGVDAGYAVVAGLGSGRLAEELVQQSELHVLVFEPDADRVDAFRRRMDAAGLYGERLVVHHGPLDEVSLPQYLANLVVSEDPRAAGLDTDGPMLETWYGALRPYGGAICLPLPGDGHNAWAAGLDKLQLDGAAVDRQDPWSWLVRSGPLPGAADYLGQGNQDQRVRMPLGLLWFGDTFHRHKLFYRGFRHETGRGLPPGIRVVDGAMQYEVTEEPYGPNPRGIGYHDYLRMLDEQMEYFAGYTDIYTGRVLTEAEIERVAPRFAPAAGTPAESPELPDVSVRRNPLTGQLEARDVVKTYGCDRWPVDYGHVMTYRSGTAAYYDNRLESGTISISGMRSGCRNHVIPAGGILTLPSWTGNCTCNYPLHTSLALAPMPPEFEQWSVWGEVAAEGPVRQVGINLGAPGNRVDPDGTLWLEHPQVGGPAPQVPVSVQPDDVHHFYRHALWMEPGEGWPWVTASGVQGLSALRIEPVVLKRQPAEGRFSVRWIGSLQPEHSEETTFYAHTDHGVRLWIGEALVLDNSQNLRRGDTGEISGTLALTAGTTYPIRLEYYQAADGRGGQQTHARLSWSSPSIPREAIPPQRLQTTDGQAGGLTGLYHETANLTGPAAARTDARVDFDWGSGLPAILHRLPRPLELPERLFTVSLYFAEPEPLAAGERVFSVRIQGQPVLTGFDVVQQAGGPHRGIQRTFTGIRVAAALQLEFESSSVKPPLLCGIRLVEED
jgi:hypothetical protein